MLRIPLTKSCYQQGFQQQLAGYQMGTCQGPRMQMHTQMAMQKQMFEQQKRMAEKQQKQNEELMKKKTFETQQRKLQAFKGKSGAKSNPLNELFGKKDGKSDKSGLIGSLGSGAAQKSVTKTSVCKLLYTMFITRGGDSVKNWIGVLSRLFRVENKTLTYLLRSRTVTMPIRVSF